MRWSPSFITTNIILVLVGIGIGRWTACFNYSPEITSDIKKSATLPTVVEDRELFASKVTVLSFCIDTESCSNLTQLHLHYPDIKVTVATKKDSVIDVSAFADEHVGQFKNKGDALNALIGSVKTEYFLHLDAYHQVDHPNTDQSTFWLLEAMEQTTSVDIVGGSVLSEQSLTTGVSGTLEIPCYRIHHYNYTYSEIYEYRESIRDMMVCERTSSSFLASTVAWKTKTLKFDAKLDALLFEDFFLRAKQKNVVVATRPEVYFIVTSPHSNRPSAVQHVAAKMIEDLIPFGLKHQVMTIRDIEGVTLQVCERYSTMRTIFQDPNAPTQLFPHEKLLCDYDVTTKHWKMKHWAYGGMFAVPTIQIALKRSLALSGDYFDSKGWPWTLVGGGALGFLKTRGFLPWEAGDIDINMNVTKKLCLDTLRTEFVARYPDYMITDHSKKEIIIKTKHGFGGWVTIFFNKYIPIVRTVRVNLDGYLVPCSYTVFHEFRKYYPGYLKHKMYNKRSLSCSEKSNACLPDFSKLYNGRGGVWSDFFYSFVKTPKLTPL